MLTELFVCETYSFYMMQYCCLDLIWLITINLSVFFPAVIYALFLLH